MLSKVCLKGGGLITVILLLNACGLMSTVTPTGSQLSLEGGSSVEVVESVPVSNCRNCNNRAESDKPASVGLSPEGDYVQILAFAIPSSLTAQVKQWIRQRNYKACVHMRGGAKRVLIGPFPPSQLESALLNIKKRFSDAFIVPAPSPHCDLINIAEKDDASLQQVSVGQSDAAHASAKEGGLSLSIKPDQDFRQVVDNLAIKMGYTRAVFEFVDPRLMSGKLVPSNTTIHILNTDLFKLRRSLNSGQIRVHIHEVADGTGQALIITDRIYRYPESIRVFDLHPGSLMRNAQRIAKQFNWIMPENGWQLDMDYRVKYADVLVFTDLESAYEQLLQRFPVRVQLVTNTRQAIFSPRQL